MAKGSYIRYHPKRWILQLGDSVEFINNAINDSPTETLFAFIHLLRQQPSFSSVHALYYMLSIIVQEIKSAKYFSISLDSTPDLAHIDQLTFTVRYVLPSGPVERFLKFLSMEGHSGLQMRDSLLDFLESTAIDIKDCRGQSYDNASNIHEWKICRSASPSERAKSARILFLVLHILVILSVNVPLNVALMHASSLPLSKMCTHSSLHPPIVGEY